MSFAIESRLRDLLTTADRQLESKSYDAAIDTYRTALSCGPTDEQRADIEARLEAASQARDAARGTATLLRDARSHQSGGRFREAFLAVSGALRCEPGNLAALGLLADLLQAHPELAMPETPAPPSSGELVNTITEQTAAPAAQPVPAQAPATVKRPSPPPGAAFRTIEPPAFHLLEDDPNALERPRPKEYIPEPPLSILDPVPRQEAPQRALLRPLLFVLLIALPILVMTVRNSRVTHRPSPLPVDQQERSYEVGDGVSAPIVVTRVEPQYTQEALDARIEGAVQLYVRVAADGAPQVLGVLHGLDPKLDRNATEAVGQWRFQPGMKDGVPVTVLTKVEVTFRLP